ncbi:unnamed protein product [Arabidopsis thaliana]|uniref:(thale cress) hypothetical protein n=1 Tax=Arabidopsis thaliana TaxID=3702 RepID=A0A7G2EBY0_ARATH|nr:unnamed protein product [Arabidopsis thaliana]
METMHLLSDCGLHSTKWRVYVKILALCHHNPPRDGVVTTMMLIDSKYNRINATITEGTVQWKYKDVLKEGFWYYMWDFQVVANTMTIRYSFCSKQVKFLRGTNMWSFPSLSASKFLDFIAPIDVKYAGPEDMNMLHDVMGIITNVYKIRRFPFAFVKERQIMKHDMLNSGLRKTCKNVLMSEYGFSKLYINPTFEDVDIPLYLRGYMLEDDKDNVMVEVVEEN